LRSFALLAVHTFNLHPAFTPGCVLVKTTLKKNGKTIAEIMVVVSQDGKITTVNYTDYSQWKPAKSTAVYDKQ
jgi:hypothetical protein